MDKLKNNKLLLIISLILTILLVSGGTFAYFQWQSSLEDKSNVIVSVTDDIRMTINPAAVTKTGMRPTNNCGGSFGMQGTSLVTIDNNTGILARPRFKLKLKITDKDGNNITNETSPMGNPYRQYIKYAVAETDGSCTSPLSSGRFNLNTETSINSGWYESSALTLNDSDGFPALSDGANSGVSFDAYADNVTTHTYKVWIWIDENYTAISTGNSVTVDKLQDATITVSWSDNSTVEQVHGDGVASDEIVRPAGEAYAVYSADDTSLRFYRSETPIEVGSTYNGLTATAVYTGFEDESYDLTTILWKDYNRTITKVIVEDEIVPVSTAWWFNNFANCNSFELDKINTTYVSSMMLMFRYAGGEGDFVLNLSGWNMSNVENVSGMFMNTAMNASNISLNLSGWDMSSVTSVSQMFYFMGENASTINLDLKNWDLSSLTTTGTNYGMFQSLGASATTSILIDVSGWNTSNITKMSKMFSNVGGVSSFEIIGLNTWDVSKVTDISRMFQNAGYDATTFTINLGGWNTSSLINVDNVFTMAGSNSTTWSIGDLSSWDVSKVTDMSRMFEGAGYSATTWSIGDISGWDVSNVIDMSDMFNEAGYSATTFNLNLSGWDTGKVKNMSHMFSYAGRNAITFNLNLSGWNTSNVTDMSSMFDCFFGGDSTTSYNIIGLDNWNVSKVIDMSYMFQGAGSIATTWSIGDLSEWNVSSVTNMKGMFDLAGLSATSCNIGDLSSWDTGNVTNMEMMFNATCDISNYSLNLSGWNVYNVNFWEDFNTNVADKITPPVWRKGNVFYAVYSATDNSLRFYNGSRSITQGGTYNGFAVTNLYTLYDNLGYDYDVPWRRYRANITKVVVEDTISPSATAYWFYEFYNCTSFDMTKLNMSKVTDTNNMFAYAGQNASTLSFIGINNWDTSKVINMDSMFYRVGYNLTNFSLNLSNWNVCNVKNYSNFNYDVTKKITPPNWEMECPT